MATQQRVAVITGGGSGIGAATAREMHANGMAVVLVGRRREPLEELAAALGDRAAVMADDISDADAPERIVAAARDAFGRLDVLVNNAATIKVGALESFSVRDFDDHIATNVRSIFFLVQHALPLLRESPDAAIVNISSVVGSVVKPGNSLYGMTKAAVEYLSRALAYELADERIRVNCIACGSVKTPIHLVWASDLEAAYRDLEPRIPMRRMAEPEEIAHWVWQLVAPATAWTTGATLAIDGGQALGAPES